MTEATNSLLDQEIDGGEDLNNPEAKGGFTRELPKAGITLLRLQSYIEVGKFQPRNKTWKPSVDCIFTFELLHPNHMITPEGKPAFPQTYTMHVAKSNTVGSRYSKLFNAMAYEMMKDGETPRHKNFNTMIGRTPFLATLVERKVGEGKDQKTFINLTDKDGVWTIKAPIYEADPIGNPGVITNVPVPEMYQKGKVFFWEGTGVTDEQIKDSWDSLFIEGETPEGKSKNWIQNLISSPENIEWEGSRTKQIVEGGVVNLPDELLNDPAAQDPSIQAAPQPTDQAAADAAAMAVLGIS